MSCSVQFKTKLIPPAILLCLTACICRGQCSSAAVARVVLSVDSGTGSAGGAVVLSINQGSLGTAQPTALRWSFSYSSDITGVTVTTGPSAASAQKAVACSSNICTVIGLNSNVIPDGVVAVATFQLAPNPSSSAIPIQITDVGVSSSTGTPIPGSGIGGTITVAATPPPPPTGPSVPANVAADAISSSEINLSWTVSSDSSSSVVGYIVYRDTSQIANVTTGTAYSDIGLSPNTLYSYTVAAYDAAANYSSQSSPADTTTWPGPPTAADWLAGEWKLDEPDGATVFADASGNGHSGACASGCPTMGVAGEMGMAARFGGGNSQITIPDSPALRLNQFTIALWVYPTQVQTDYQPLLVKEDSTGHSRNYGLFIVPNTMQVRYAAWSGDCATKFAADSFGDLALNTWNHIAFTYDGAVEKLYLNGVLDNSNTASTGSLCQAAVPVKLGMETSAFLPFNGTLDDVRIYSQALSAAEVSSLCSPLAASWTLDEASGAMSFADASGNGNAGTCSASSCPTMGVAGKVGTAASFNGVNRQIIVPDSPSLRLNQFTIALWVYPTQVRNNYQLLVAKEDSSGNSRNYGLLIVPNTMQVRYAIWTGDCATKFAANSASQLALNTWTHVAFTYDGAVEKLYLNGVLDSSNAASTGSLCQAAVPVKLGMETSAFLPFNGTLDDIQIYSEAMSGVAVGNLYLDGLFGQ